MTPVTSTATSARSPSTAGKVFSYCYYFKNLNPVTGSDENLAVIRLDDVTERVRMEEVMVQTEKMMSVGGLAAGMAHEINNPLGIIMQATQNMQRRFSTELAANIKVAKDCGTDLSAIQNYIDQRCITEFMTDIHKAGGRAAEIVCNMLQFSRNSTVQKKMAELPSLIDKAVQLAASDYDLKKKYDFRHITITRQYQDNLPSLAVVVTEFEQVILNLLKNGAYAMAGIDNPQFTLRINSSKDRIVIEVEDNGHGMNEEVRRRVFEPFFTTKPVGKGTGLGLSVSYMIITNNHNGTMEVKSNPGKGCCFIITLPLLQSIQPDPSSPPPQGQNHHSSADK